MKKVRIPLTVSKTEVLQNANTVIVIDAAQRSTPIQELSIERYAIFGTLYVEYGIVERRIQN